MPTRRSQSKRSSTPRLPRAERERLIIEGAMQFFAEVGFGGDTRELARRLKITHPLLFRYFPSKGDLIERVYQEVFVGRWNPYWEMLLANRSLPLRTRMLTVYKAFAQTVFNYEWVRLFMFAGLKGSDINRRWYAFMREHLVGPVCLELRKEFNMPTIEELPLTQTETELVFSMNGRMFYLGVRKFIYHVSLPDDINSWIETEISMFFDGAVKFYPTIATTAKRRTRKPPQIRAA
jgi:AcrR family transcriptional regulator